MTGYLKKVMSGFSHQKILVYVLISHQHPNFPWRLRHHQNGGMPCNGIKERG